MSYSAKVESLTAQLIESVVEILKDNVDRALSLAHAYEWFKDDRGLVELIWDLATDEDGNHSEQQAERSVRGIAETASVAELFHVIKLAILADSEVEDEELELAMELLQNVISRYTWKKAYARFDPLVDASEVRELLSQWEKDDDLLGGNYAEGAVVMPFATLVMLACMIKGDARIHDTFSQVTLLVAKMIISAGGVGEEEVAFQNDLKAHRSRERGVIDEMIASARNSSARGTSSGNAADITVDVVAPAKAMEESMRELQQLVGVPEVKAEIQKLTNFLRVRQQRLDAGLPLPSQSLHFVFTGNPGTGKTTVARIVSRLLYGFGILGTPTLVEADRSTLVGGYLGQTAIKTNEVIEKAINGVLFVDEAYTLTPKTNFGDQYGQEAIDTLLKRMEDLRDRLVVIVAGYPQLMKDFLAANPGLESRFTRFIHFDDYHVSDLCRIYEGMCLANSYSLTQQARANLAIVFNRAYAKKDEKFGNARFVRNVYEKTLGNHADRLANAEGAITTEILSTIEAEDIPFGMVLGLSGPFDASESKWNVRCPGCDKVFAVGLSLIGNRVNCKCGAKFRCPWWNLRPETVASLSGFKTFDRPDDLLGYDAALPTRKE